MFSDGVLLRFSYFSRATIEGRVYGPEIKKSAGSVEKLLTSFRLKNDIAKVTKASRPATAHGRKYGWACK